MGAKTDNRPDALKRLEAISGKGVHRMCRLYQNASVFFTNTAMRLKIYWRCFIITELYHNSWTH